MICVVSCTAPGVQRALSSEGSVVAEISTNIFARSVTSILMRGREQNPNHRRCRQDHLGGVEKMVARKDKDRMEKEILATPRTQV